MKGFFRKLGFRRSDEMEQEIALKSLRWSALYSTLALFALTVYDMVSLGEVGWAFFILITQSLVLWVAQIVLTRRMGGGGDEE